MPIRVGCPGCGAVCAVPPELCDKDVRCQRCQRVFVARPLAVASVEDAAEAPPPEVVLPEEDVRAGRPRAVAPPPPEVEPIRPRPRRPPARPEPPRSAVPVAVAVGAAAGLVVLVVVGVAGWLVYRWTAAEPSAQPGPVAAGQPAPPAGLPDLLKPPAPAEGAARREDRLRALVTGRFTRPPRSAAPTTYVRAISSPGDFIGQGKEYSYQGAQITARTNDRGVELSVDGWDLLFGGPRGQFLHEGEYRNARRYPFSDDAPGLEFIGNGRGCNELHGEFMVWELDVQGGQVNHLAIDFVQRCEGRGPPLYGMVRYNSSLD